MAETISKEPYRPSVSLLGWAFNEQENLPTYVRRAEALLRSVSDDYELVLIDDGSQDRTWQVACELQRARPWLKLIRNESNKGVGYNYARAIKGASKEYFFCQTLDWSYDVTELIESFDLLRCYDVLQGVRPRLAGLRVFTERSDTIWKGVVSIANYLLIRMLFRLPLTDYQNITVCPTRLAQHLKLVGRSSFANPELLLKLWWQGASFKEIQVPFRKREGGRGTGTRVLSILRSIRDILWCWFTWMVLQGRRNRTHGTVARLARPEAARGEVRLRNPDRR